MFNITDTRNVIDKFKGMENDAIRSELQQTAFPYAVMGLHITGDFNLSTVLRNSNAFNAQCAYYYGPKKQWDRRGALGVHHYTSFTHLRTIDDVIALKSQYHFVGVDNIPGSVELETFDWPTNTLMIFGEEGGGLTQDVIDLCESIVYIKQYGSVRSLNVGTAAGIVMNDFVTKYNRMNK